MQTGFHPSMMRRQPRGEGEWPSGGASYGSVSRAVSFQEAVVFREILAVGRSGSALGTLRQEERRISGRVHSSSERDSRYGDVHRMQGPVKSRPVPEEHRHWLYSSRKPLPTEDRFVIVSYNILGVGNATQHRGELYWHIPSHIMHWDRRKERILQEIGLWSPDVLCLQEVDRFEGLQEELHQRGYAGVFKGRTGVACDGCATFWRRKRFRLLEEESIEFRELDLRDNVAQLCVLQVKCRRAKMKRKRAEEIVTPKNCILVCNIHVLFNPNRGDIKIGQVRLLLEKAHVLSEKWGGIPAVITGDFNSTPQSALYQFLSHSELDVSSFNRRRISGQVGLENSYPRQHPRKLMQQEEPMKHLQELGSQVQAASRQVLHEEPGLFTSQPQQMQFSGMMADGAGPSGVHFWSPDELKASTGDPSCTIVRHKFKLQSAYASIEGPSDKRDSFREPLATTFHRKFMGTVDYMWYTEGLYPVRVLDLLPIPVLKRTGGLPSKKWASDHLALACELVFVDRKKPKDQVPEEDHHNCSSDGDSG